MYCSNKSFINIATNAGVNPSNLYEVLSIVSALLKKYGNLVKSSVLQSIISKENPQVGKIISLLYSIDKLDKIDVKEMLRQLSKSAHKASFMVKGGKENEQLMGFIQKKFVAADVSIQSNEQIMLQVSGEGLYYKRGLEMDLDKVLS